ncbi:hypothetical protein JCM10207_005946 [Rhodosporidiobolus poonsookiae]
MRPPSPLLTLLVVWFLPTLALAAFKTTKQQQQRNNLGQATQALTYGGQRIAPGQFIIEVEEGNEGEELEKRADGAASLLDSILTLLSSPPSTSTSSGAFNPLSLSLNLTLTARRTFTSSPGVFTGAVVTLAADAIEGVVSQGEEGVRRVVQGLSEVEGIKRAWPLRLIAPPTPVSRDGSSSSSSSTSTSSRLSKRAYAPSVYADELASYADDTFGPHVMAGVDKLHAQGLLGEGVRVGIIDTGVDYLNPILGGCFGPGCPISFGASFVASSTHENEDGTAQTTYSSDPYTNCTEHGTHVTGIVAARANSLGFSGVAPRAEVGHYRIFDCEESTGEDVVVAALLQASADDCAVISLSLGSNAGWLDASPSQVVVERLTSVEGRHVVVSAGNERAEGLFFASAPASAREAISVGSVDSLTLPAFPLTVLAPRLSLPYLSPTPLDLSALPFSYPATGLRLYFTSNDSSIPDDACGQLPRDTPDLSRRVVVIKRGVCTFDEKLAAVQAKGAQIVLVYNSPTSGNMIPYLSASSTPGLAAVASLRYEEGVKLLELYNARPRGVYVAFPQEEGMVQGVTDTEGGGIVSYFSQYGPTFELFGQPSLTAPGGNILSTFPIDMGGLGVISGTSMSCPFVSGAVALLLSARKDLNLSPIEARALLATTAKKTFSTVNGSDVESVLLQGGGMIQVDKALAAGTILTPSSLSLNDSAHFVSTATLTLRNTNSLPMLYTFSSTTAAVALVYDTSSTSDVLMSTSPPSLPGSAAASARVAFSSRALRIEAGQTATVTLRITAPRVARSQLQRFPVYSGYIEVVGRLVGGSKTEELSVPYFGVAAAMSDMPVLDTTATIYGDVAYPFIATGFDYQTGPNSYGFATGFDIYMRLAAGTRFLSIDLILADTPFTATIPSTRAVSSSSSSRFARLAKRDPLTVSLGVSLDSSSSSSLLSSLSLNASTLLSTSPSSSSSGKLYADTPTVGNIATATLVPRDYLVDGTPLPYSETVTSFVPSEARFADQLDYAETASKGTKYKVLIRALKITADPALESSYESYVSFPFSLVF